MDQGQEREIGGKEVVILEKQQKGEIDGDGKNHHPFGAFLVSFSVLFDKKAESVRHGNGSEHQQNVDGLAPTVKGKAYNKEHEIAPFAWNNIVAKQGQGQIRKQKYQG